MKALLQYMLTVLGAILSGSKAEHAEHTLVPFTFSPLPLGSIAPNGWLRDQLQLMADGLAGHEHDFYMYVRHSTWLGGEEEYSDLREGVPVRFLSIVLREKNGIADESDYTTVLV